MPQYYMIECAKIAVIMRGLSDKLNVGAALSVGERENAQSPPGLNTPS